MNDINIAANSRTISRLLSGEFPRRIPFIIIDRGRTWPYYLVHEVYPSWAVFVRSAKGATSAKMKALSIQQEAMRKDVERTFGVLVQSWQILARLCRPWDKAQAINFVRACVVLHNKTVRGGEGARGRKQRREVGAESRSASGRSVTVS